MPTAEAHLATERADRYLVQLCSHLGQMNRMSHRLPAAHGNGRTLPAVQHVDCTDNHGTIRFADGLWTMDATDDALTLRIEADDEESLQCLQAGIAARIEKIGRRDGLRVEWQRTDAAADYVATVATGRATRRPRRTTAAWAAGGALIVAVHLGIGGAALESASWTGWAANAVLALLAAKLLLMGGHLVLGRAAVRRGLAARHHGKRTERPDADAAT